MGQQEKQVMQKWFDKVWGERCDATIGELLAPDAKAFGIGENEADAGKTTPELFRRFHSSFCTTFPELKIRVAQILSEGEDVALRLECEGRYAKARPGAPSVKFGAMVFTTVRDGRIVHGWNMVDESAMAKGIAAATAS